MPTDLSNITIRTITDEEFPALLDVAATAFGETVEPGEVETDRAVLEIDRTFGAFEGDKPVGLAGAYTFRMTVPGGEVGAAGITLVAVLPTHTRRGILRAMMTRLLEQALERGEPVAILWASEAAIYQRFGYGMAVQSGSFEAVGDKVVFLQPLEPAGRVRILDDAEALELIPPIYEMHRRQAPGSIDRSSAKWSAHILADAGWMRAGMGAKVRVVLEVDGEARAFAIYRIKADWDATGPKHSMTVFDVIGLDAESEQRLWQWLFGIDLVGTVKGWRQPVPHPLALMVTEPRRLALTVGDGTWLRILDVAAALGGRTYRGPGGLVLDVTDTFLPHNAGRWKLHAPEPGVGRATLVPTTGNPDLALDISALAAVYLGSWRFADLARAGRVTECHPGAVAAADELFGTVGARPHNSTMF